MPSNDLYLLSSPKDIQNQIASGLKKTRLEVKGWKRDTLAEKSGVPASTIKRFERTGEISLRQLLMLTHSLDLLDQLKDIFAADAESMSMDDYINQNKERKRMRGTR